MYFNATTIKNVTVFVIIILFIVENPTNLSIHFIVKIDCFKSTTVKDYFFRLIIKIIFIIINYSLKQESIFLRFNFIKIVKIFIH